MKEIADLLREQPVIEIVSEIEVENLAGSTRPALSVSEAMVSAEGVTKSFGAVEVLKGIDIEVARGQVVCLIGPSGSGKSTFLRCINNLETIDSGWLPVDGELVGFRQEGNLNAPKSMRLRDFLPNVS